MMACLLEITSFYGVEVTVGDFLKLSLELWLQDQVWGLSWRIDDAYDGAITLRIGARWKTTFRSVGRHRAMLKGMVGGHAVSQITDAERLMLESDFARVRCVVGPIAPEYHVWTRVSWHHHKT